MYNLANWAKTKITTFGLFLGFSILRQYSTVCVWFKNMIQDQYYNGTWVQSYMNSLFIWHHWFSTTVLKRHIEPLYDPWITTSYVASGELKEIYRDLKLTDNIYSILDHEYHIANMIKQYMFDTCHDYLVLMRYKQMYISRVGIYQGQKNLRKEDFSMEKTAKSILMVEYTHPKMSAPILLNLDPGYFIENNEILSPMFVRRALMYGSAPYVFDYGYKLKIIDSNIKTHVIDSRSFVLLKKQGYEVVAI